MLPDKGPWPHPYYAIDDTFVEVAFTDVGPPTLLGTTCQAEIAELDP
jgi:hypothetical protein